MNPTPQWIMAGVAIAGLLGNATWTLVNLRIENKVLTHIDQLKEWADERFVRRGEPLASNFSSPRRQARADS